MSQVWEYLGCGGLRLNTPLMNLLRMGCSVMLEYPGKHTIQFNALLAEQMELYPTLCLPMQDYNDGFCFALSDLP